MIFLWLITITQNEKKISFEKTRETLRKHFSTLYGLQEASA